MTLYELYAMLSLAFLLVLAVWGIYGIVKGFRNGIHEYEYEIRDGVETVLDRNK